MSPPCLFLEAAGLDDVPALAALERRCFSHPWTHRLFEEAVSRPERGRVLVLRGGASRGEPGRDLVAYCAVQTVGDEAEIHNLAVDPAQRGRGYGRLLLGLALARVERRGAHTAVLEVRRSNWPALRLYQSEGFETVGIRRAYYTRPREDALVLRRNGLAPDALAARRARRAKP